MPAGTIAPVAPLFRDAPPHWRWMRLKRTVTGCQNGLWGDEPQGAGDDRICIRVADIDRVKARVTLDDPTWRAIPAAECRGRLLRPGDLLLEKSGGGELQPVGVVALYDHRANAVCSNFLARMPVAAGFDPAYLCYLHAALYRYGITTRSIKQSTGIQNLDADSYLAESVKIPPLAEQHEIARWLDWQVDTLLALIAKHERLVALVQEKRLAIISRAMTPENAGSTRLKFLRVGALLYGANQAGVAENPEWPRYIRITDIGANGKLRGDTVQSLAPELAAPYPLADGDILLARSGATVGKAFRYRAEWGRACFAGYLLRLRPDRRKVLPDYLIYYTQSHAFRQEVARQTIQATIANVSAERFSNFVITLPPLAAQQAVVDTLDRTTGLLDELIGKVQMQLEKLLEYRDALISGAVTSGAGGRS
jgi:type I restriction enzyme, S subunit